MAEIRRNPKQMKDLNSSSCDYKHQVIVFNLRSLQKNFEIPRQFVVQFYRALTTVCDMQKHSSYSRLCPVVNN